AFTYITGASTLTSILLLTDTSSPQIDTLSLHDALPISITVTAGLGGMGGAQPLAVTMTDGVCIAIEVDESRIDRRIDTRYADVKAKTLDEAIKLAEEAKEKGEALSIGLLGNASDI